MKSIWTIKLNQPNFRDYYLDTLKKSEYREYHDLISSIIRKFFIDLVTNSKLDTGVRIPYEKVIDNLRSEVREKDLSYVFRGLEAKGFVKLKDGAIELMAEGKKWLFKEDSSQNNDKNIERKTIFSFFNISSEKASKKIKTLFNEIDVLPGDLNEVTTNYGNLISHQLRTILFLLLIQICDDLKDTKIKVERKKGLRKLMDRTMALLDQDKSRENNRIKSLIKEIKDNKYKDLIDDIVHCSYTLADKGNTERLVNIIRHLSSLVFGR